ncbi:MAG: type IV toxin-antitoxin system AbiEi family antitoxin domain-containing protein [Roseburia sp.]|nr:type IV toxin-antitoxin system AbiEi family antitoxin domain-containing protein [Roseburia sp.]
MDQIWMRIKEVAEANNGFIKTAQVEEQGISRPMLRKYTNAGKLEQVRKGLYILTGDIADEYALLQARSKVAVFSYGTALFLVDMQLYSQAIKNYFKSKPNNRKLLKYGKVFGIEDKIRTYMEVL